MRRLLLHFRNMSESRFLLLTLGTVFVYCFALAFQGLDLVDEGWCLSAYQQLFEHPQSAEYQMLYYNAILVGALWNSLFGSWGILGFRLLSVLCIVLTTLTSYYLLKQHISRWGFLVGVVLLLSSHNYTIVFHHNGLTALFVTLTSLLFFLSLKKNRIRYSFCGGIILAITFFTRIPNLSMLSLLLVFVIYFLYTKDLKSTSKYIVSAISGIAIGLLIEIVIMAGLGHLDLFYESLSSGFSAIDASDSTHNISKLFRCYKYDYVTIGQYVLMLLAIPSIAYSILQAQSIKSGNLLFSFVCACLYFMQIFYSHAIAYSLYTLYAFCWINFGVYLMRNKSDKSIAYLTTLSSCVLFFLPFGSDYGVGNMGRACIFTAVPLSCGLLFRSIASLKRDGSARRIITLSFVIFFCAFGLRCAITTSRTCYFDAGSRLVKTSQPLHPLANTYTTPERCNKINDLMTNLSQFVKEKDTMLCWQCAPTIHYLTHTYPYLNNSWPWTYDVGNLERHFEKAMSDNNRAPLVLCCKSSISMWDKFNPDWDNENASDQWNFNTRKIQIFHQFISEYAYETVWENELFRIMLPRERLMENIPEDSAL